jgi:hypothetical protein
MCESTVLGFSTDHVLFVKTLADSSSLHISVVFCLSASGFISP